MSLWIMLLIMVIAAIIGGFVNFLLPANSLDGKFIKPWWQCVVLGFGATLLVPIFLEMAQSKLMEDIEITHSRHDCINKDTACNKNTTRKIDSVTITVKYDTATKKIERDTTRNKKQSQLQKTAVKENEKETGKNYFLWAAYCLLAAAAGFRFINMLINNIVKDQKINQLENANEALNKDKEKRTANSQISQVQEAQKLVADKAKEIRATIAENPALANNIPIPFIPQLPPITHPDDPQKGRFGGKAENNSRKISATVLSSSIPNFFNVKLIVESTDPENNPLNTDVIFYIHDSFSPSVFSYSPAEFINGKAIEDEILSYGAFTVGVITDNGKTLLELDLAEDKTSPKEFRER